MAKHSITSDGATQEVGDGDTVKINITGGGTATITADPNDNVDKVKIEFINDTEADVVTIDLSTFSEDGLHIDIKHYDPTDTINLLGAFNRYVDPSDPDEYTFDYIGSDGETYTGFVHAKDGGEKDFTAADPPIIICFGKGTLIKTNVGTFPVENLQIGDLVETADGSTAPIKWIGKTTLDSLALTRAQHLRPILVRRDALGPERPFRDLILSPNHRVLVSDWRAQLLCGADEVLVPIKSLLNDHSIVIDQSLASVTYFHLLLDSHQIVESNGLPSESLFLGSQSLDAISDKALAEIQATMGASEFSRASQQPAALPIIRHQLALCLAA